jgi:iron complex transport system ATP-binding protein
VPLSHTRLACDNLTVTVADRPLVSNLNVNVEAGSFVCVLGTNGVGKTLTLHTLAGLRAPHSGGIRLNGENLTSLPRKEIARRLGLLLQIHDDAFPMTVMDSVLMGRYPHAGFWQWSGSRDREAVIAALHQLDLNGIDNRIITSLSGGERERVALATILVQDPAIWLLDEPTNHLDPHHQLIVLDTLKSLARRQRIIITTVHNPALAMRYADFVLLLFGDGEWEFGPAGQLLEPGRLERMYRTPFDYYQSSAGRRTLLPV